MGKCGYLAAVALLTACTTEADLRADRPIMVAPVMSEASWRSGDSIADPAGQTPPVRTGISPSGHQYRYGPGKEGRILTGPSGLVAWVIECQMIASTAGTESCYIQDGQGRLKVRFAPTGVPQDVCILPHGALGRIATIRVDQRSSVRTDWGGCTISTVAVQMQSASSVTLGYTPRHEKDQKEETLSLGGYRDATELLKFLQTGALAQSQSADGNSDIENR